MDGLSTQTDGEEKTSLLPRLNPPANGPQFATSLIRIPEVVEQAHKDNTLISG